MDYGHKMTDELLESLEKDITEIYANAKEDAQKKAETYFQKFEAKDKQLKALVDSGQMDEKDYKQWRTNHFMAGARYKAMADGLAADMTNANKIAASAINGHLPDVYATNYNWGTYKIEQDARMDTNFMIYDRQTVERLIRDKPELLPIKARIDVPEDMRWNKKQINGAITKGILTGASIPEMAKNLAGVADMNKVSALRNARTMTTSAENGGRIDSYQRAIDMGIKITQQWMATKDARTRPEHKELDGQERKVGEAFEVEGYKIMFPGDPEAEPFLTYNCRCTLVSNFKGFDHKKMDAYTEAEPMSYKEWTEKHEKSKEAEKKPSYFNPIDIVIKEGQEMTITQKNIDNVNKLFKELDDKYHAEIKNVEDLLVQTQKQWDWDVKVYAEEMMKNYGYSKQKAERIAKEAFGARPEKVSLFLGGEYNFDTQIIAMNTRQVVPAKNIQEDIEARMSWRNRNAERIAEGRKPQHAGNVTGSFEGTFIHEYGHAIDYTYGVAENPKFLEYYNKFTEEAIDLDVSNYATTNPREFIAECFADSYMGEAQSEISKGFMKILEEIINGKP